MRFLNFFLGALKIFLAAITILAGIDAMFTPITAMSGPLGLLYSTRIGLVIFGLIVVASGLTLLIGKLFKKRKLTGTGLMAVYLCFLFAAIFQGFAFAWEPWTWVPNAVAAMIAAGLWLWWRLKTYYIDPAKFRKEIAELR